MTTSIPTDQIDQTHRALAATQPSLLTLPFRLLPTWAMVALALVGAYYAKRLLVIYQLHAKAERYRLERRRKAGIPDSDKREFRLAAAEVLRARKVEDERRELERAMRKRAGRFKSDWERLGAVNGMRERPSQQRVSFSLRSRCRRSRAARGVSPAGQSRVINRRRVPQTDLLLSFSTSRPRGLDDTEHLLFLARAPSASRWQPFGLCIRRSQRNAGRPARRLGRREARTHPPGEELAARTRRRVWRVSRRWSA